jgi:hypothetical protein
LANLALSVPKWYSVAAMETRVSEISFYKLLPYTLYPGGIRSHDP